MKIRFLRNHEIDTEKWDNCIARAVNGNITAYSWYLDIVNPSWSALVLDDYVAIMPLPMHERYGYLFLITPFFWEESAVYSPIAPDSDLLQKFSEILPKIFHYITFKADLPFLENKRFTCKHVSFHELDLVRPYKFTKASFEPQLIEILHVCKEKLFFRSEIMPSELLKVIDFGILPSERQKLNILRKLLGTLLQRRALEILGAYDEHNEMVAAFCIGKSHGRARLFFAWKRKQSDALYAFHGLINNYLQSNTLKTATLVLADFGRQIGTEIAESFGASEFVYTFITDRRLSLIARFIKPDEQK